MRCRQEKEIGKGVPPTPSEPMLRKRLWSPQEDNKLTNYIMKNGLLGGWNYIATQAGIHRSGKSCRLRWNNYLRPGLKRSAFSDQEERMIIHLQSVLRNRWSIIAAKMPGRTDNELKNYWNSCIKKKLNLKNHLSSSTTNTKSSIPSQSNTNSVSAHAHDALTSSHSAQLYLDSMPEGSQSPNNTCNVVTTGQNHFCAPGVLELHDQIDHEFSIDPDPTNIQQTSYSQLWMNTTSIHTPNSFGGNPSFIALTLQDYKTAKSPTSDQLMIESCNTTVPPHEAPHSAHYFLGSTGINIPSLLESEWLKKNFGNVENHMMFGYSNALSALNSYSNAADFSHVVDPGACTTGDAGISIQEDSERLYDRHLIGFYQTSFT